jgi:uncharacterized protein involved in type VI secretion and phage assembly
MSPIETHVPAVQIKVKGVPFDPELNHLIELRLQQSLVLPDTFAARFTDPKLELVKKTFDIGDPVELSFCSADGRTLQKVFDGEITSLEPEFGRQVVLAIRGYDRSHRMNREKRSETFPDMTATQIVQKIASKHGLSVKAEETGPSPPPKFMEQKNETDWQWIVRLATMNDFEVLVEGRELTFRKAGKDTGGPVKCYYGPRDPGSQERPRLLDFHPRVTGIQQAKEVIVRSWDPAKKTKIEAKATPRIVEIGIHRADVVKKLGGGSVTIVDAPVTSVGEARKLAEAAAQHAAEAFREATGTTEGDPRIKAGSDLQIEGLGPRFSGKYHVSAVTHIFSGSYRTKFTVAGRAPRTLLDLMTPASKKSLEGLVVAIVTNNEDPDKLGRVRVKFPGLNDLEGWWARIATVHAGKDRGLLMLPKVGDEVLVGFENGDLRKPYVLGSLFNGKDTPGEMVDKDGSFWLKSDKFIEVRSKDNVTVKTDKDMTVEIKGDANEKVAKTLTVKVDQNEEIKVGQSFKLEAGTELTLKCGGAQIKLSASGQIEIKGTMVTVQGSGPLTLKGATVAIN